MCTTSDNLYIMSPPQIIFCIQILQDLQFFICNTSHNTKVGIDFNFSLC